MEFIISGIRPNNKNLTVLGCFEEKNIWSIQMIVNKKAMKNSNNHWETLSNTMRKKQIYRTFTLMREREKANW